MGKNCARPYSKLISSLAIAAVMAGAGSAHAGVVGGFEDLTAYVGPGFGSGINKYSWSSSAFNGNIYIGTFNINFDVTALGTYIGQILDPNTPDSAAAAFDAFRRMWSGSPLTPSTGGEIWQYNPDTSTWKQVLKAGEEDVGFRKMVEYDGVLYAGTANGPDGPMPDDSYYKSIPDLTGTPLTVTYGGADDSIAGTSLYRSSDGVSWEKMEAGEGPMANKYNSSNRAMSVIDGKLWVGTENVIDGPELWSYDGNDWILEYKLEPSRTSGGGDNTGLAISEITGVNGDIFFGTWASGDGALDSIEGQGFKLLKLESDKSVTDYTPVFDDPEILNGNSGVMQLYTFTNSEGEKHLYLGTVNYTEGFTFLRTLSPEDKSSWDVITTDGFATEAPGVGTSNNVYTWSTEIIDGITYMGTCNMGTSGSDSALFASDYMFESSFTGAGQIWYTEDGLEWNILVDEGFGDMFNIGFRTMTSLDGQLVVGSASNMFFPDFYSEPYSADLEYFYQLIDSLGINLSDDQLKSLLAHINNISNPYIGTRVYMSNPVPEPATTLLMGLGIAGLAGLRRKRK